MFISYSSAFNILDNSFDYLPSIDSFCNFCDVACVAVNKSKDNTIDELHKLTKTYPNLKIIDVDIDYEDPLLDGKIKNEALKFAETFTGEYFLGLDLDEELIGEHKDRWNSFAELFIDYYKYDAMLIPSVNLWGSRETVRWDSQNNRAYKWYCHRRGLCRRPIAEGIKSDGFLEISKTDGCEICVDDSGILASTVRIDQELDNIYDGQEYFSRLKKDYPYVIHAGFSDFNRRLVRVQNFWENQWKKCSNQKSVDIINKLEDFDYPTIPHNLFDKINNIC